MRACKRCLSPRSAPPATVPKKPFMEPIRKILAIVDPTCEERPAVAKAALLAKQFDAQLELFACDTKASRTTRRTIHTRAYPTLPFVEDLRPLLESLAAPLRVRGLAVDTSTTELADSLYMAVLKRTQHTMADFVVKETHHHSFARRTFLSNTDWQLIRHCPLPLLLVKPRPWSSSPRIVAAIDPGHVSDKPAMLDRHILDYASFVTQRLGGQLHVAHAYISEVAVAKATAGRPTTRVRASEVLQREEHHKQAQITSLLADFHVAPANIHIQLGSPTEYLPQLADLLPADIVVMSAIARSGLGRTFVGSTAEDILEHLPSDALVIKIPDFAESLPF